MKITYKDKIDLYYKISRHLGFGRGLRSNSDLYAGGAINTFSYTGSSIWTFTILTNKEELCVGIEVNTTYFDSTDQVKKVNSATSYSKPIKLQEVVDLLIETT